jgi:hypothetical protein
MSRTENPRNKVLEVYPKAVCKKRKRSFGYDVFNGTKIIAGAFSAVQAWKNAEAKLNKRVNSS